MNTSLPHVILPLGKIGDDNLPGAICLVDSAAGLTTGSEKFLASIAHQYPHTVARLYALEDYTPITLSGIVSKENVSFITELNVGFEVHLPYLTSATGTDITVNSIIGLPFIKAYGRIINTMNDLLEIWQLDCTPLKLVAVKP